MHLGSLAAAIDTFTDKQLAAIFGIVRAAFTMKGQVEVAVRWAIEASPAATMATPR